MAYICLLTACNGLNKSNICRKKKKESSAKTTQVSDKSILKQLYETEQSRCCKGKYQNR